MTPEKINDHFFKIWSAGNGTFIFLALLFFAIFVAPPLIEEGVISAFLLEIFFLAILVSGVFCVPTSLMVRGCTILIVFTTLLTRFTHLQYPENYMLTVLDCLLAVVTLVLFAALLIRRFLMAKCDLHYRIAAAVAVYLIFGILWARLYEMAYLENPHAFLITVAHNGPESKFSLLYFSFVTLLTIGYGDIVPVSMVTRNLAILEGLVGQLYMIILISSLVSEFTNSSANQELD